MINLVGSDLFDADLLTVLIAYLFLFYGQVTTGTFAFGQGLLIDMLSGGLNGLFALLYLCAFGGIYLGSRLFDLNHPKGQVLLVSSAVLLKRIVFFVVVTLFSQEVAFSRHYIWISASSAVFTGLCAPVLFHIFNRLRGVSPKEHPGAYPGQLLIVSRMKGPRQVNGEGSKNLKTRR
ncbi:MAG: rod shape-determining protein MreD [Pseudomonadota bacterium]